MPNITYKPHIIRPAKTQSSIAPAILENNVVKIAFVAVSIFLLYNVLHSVDITLQKVKILENARTEVENLRVTNLELATQLQNMQTVEYIEVEARDRLNFSGNGDVVFVVPEDLLNTAGEKLGLILDDRVEESQSNLSAWLDLLVNGS